MKRFNATLALILINTMIFGEALNFVSPQTAGTSGYLNTGQSTALSINNPALIANTQRYTFDFSYFFLGGLTGDETGTGHIVNLSAAMPSKYGVFSSTVNGFFNNELSSTDLNLGTTGHINLNFSKELYSDLYFGGGLTALLGTPYGGEFDWGLGLNLGVVKIFGDVDKYVKDIRIGGAINNIGKPYGAVDSFFKPVVPAYTPSLFVDFSPYKNDKISTKLSTELSFPNVSNVNLKMGAGLNFLENFNLESSIEFDLDSVANSNYERLIPSIYFGYNLNPSPDKEVKSKYDEAQFYISANPYDSGVWAFGGGGTLPIGERDTNPPRVDIEYSDTSYISPNYDGVSDELLFPVTVTDERYIAGFEFEITDNFGKVVKSVVNKEERPENESIKNLYSKLVTPKSGIPVPETFRWDGLKDSGEMAEDGTYYFTTTFYDDNGNITKSKKYKFVIDSKKPDLEITKPTGLDLIFSPNGDGNKDVLAIPQRGSEEALWRGEISDFMGNVVKYVDYNNSNPVDFLWDGKDNLGQLVPDGVYKYTLKSTDLAGNKNEDFVDNIIINTKQPPVGITIDTNSFSPNRDNVKDTMEFVLDVPVKTGIVNWKLEIKNRGGDVLNTFDTSQEGFSVIEDNIIYKGDKRGGGFLSEGSYYGELSVVYQNGHSPVVKSPEFTIDLTPPSATVKKAYPIFSPNGDGSKDEIVFNQNSSNEERWLGEITNEFNEVVFNREWVGSIDQTFTWDGKNLNGELLEDGNYFYRLSSVDSSGNSYDGKAVDFRIDRSKTEVDLNLSKTAFSPGDGGDKIDISPIPQSSVSVNNYSVTVEDSIGNVVKTISKGSKLDASYPWDGKDSNGKILKDGLYSARALVEFENGNIVDVKSTDIILDTKKPEVTVRLKESNGIFSPNGDGLKDSLTFIQTTSTEANWIGEVLDSTGKVVSMFNWSGNAPKEFEYLGLNLDNTTLRDGSYSYRLSSVDKAGNRGSSKDIKLSIDTEDVDLFVSTDSRAFSPNGDGNKDTIQFIPEIKKIDGIDNAIYEVINSDNRVVFSREVKDNFSSPLTWNGSGEKDGDYRIKLTVNYKRGDSPVASVPFIIDSVPPLATISVDNSVFSPNGDGSKDLVKISNSSQDIAKWTLKISDSTGSVVKTALNQGEVSNWSFDGRDGDLKLLEDGSYFYTLEAEDEAGNRFSSERIRLILDNSISTLSLSSDYNLFSPNSDRVKDRVEFTTRLDSISSVDSWVLNILDSKGVVVKDFKGNSAPGNIIWDGLNSSGNVVTDGTYRVELTVVNENGNRPKSTIPSLVVDTKYPLLTATTDYKLFSPNGDSLKDSILIKQNGSGEELYSGTLTNSKGEVIREWFWKNSIKSLNWDGKDSSGNTLQDGVYSYRVSTTDRAGNRASVAIEGLEIDNSETDIYITYKKPVFAPDLFKELGGQTFGLIVNNRKGIDSWKVDILDSNNKVVNTLEGDSNVPETTQWDGKDSRGNLTNGVFKARFNVEYKKGNSPVYMTKEFVSDSKPPQVKVVTTPTPFSPDSDYVDDELTIELGVKDDSKIKEWSFDITDPKGNGFIRFGGTGKPGNRIIWDGKSSKGELVQAAEEYNYTMTVVDEAGHETVVQGEIPVDVLVIKDGDKLKIQISSIIFQPNSTTLDFSGSNGESNKKILKRLSEILKKYSSYKIVVEGHANNIYGDEITRKQKESLVDFSKNRAESVIGSLIDLGINKNRLSSLGMGGDYPVVSVYDHENTWKNRRVEFILVK